MREDIYEILIQLGFKDEPSKSFRMVREELAISLSTSKIDYEEIKSILGFPPGPIWPNSSSIFSISKSDNSDVLVCEMFFDNIDHDFIKDIVLRFFQSEIRDDKINYLLD